MFSIHSEPLPGLFIIKSKNHRDKRGDFFKIYNSELFLSLGINFQPKEYFYTKSQKHVIRGMHFQIGEAAHDKLVYCSSGKVLDVIVDVRKESMFFNKPFSIELSGTDSTIVFISKGYAHGFLSKTQISTMHYFTSTVHQPLLDRGVLWSSIDFKWPIKKPIISDRDMKHPLIKDIKCEFS